MHLLLAARLSACLLCAAAGLAAAAPMAASAPPPAGPGAAGAWTAYGGDGRGQRFAADAQVTPGNVAQLQPAWTFRTGELDSPITRHSRKHTFEATPLFIDGRLFFSTATGRVFALDAGTGAEIWRFDAGLDPALRYAEMASRGVSYWVDQEAPLGAACRRRILFASLDARLFALDADTGRRCEGFGEHGEVPLYHDVRLQSRGDYLVTSPPAVVRGVAVVGSAIGDNRAVNVELGAVRGFDARSGKLLWTWDPIPRGPEGAPTWTGAANAWSVFASDEALGLVFIPTGSASPDFYGGERPGDNRWANSVVALEARSGRLVWGRQLVHHDLWDYDVASQPMLMQLRRDGREVPALVQLTKTGQVFVFDRRTGDDLYPVEERPVPASRVPGEQAWPTQPVSSLPLLSPHDPVTPGDAWGLTPVDRYLCARRIRQHDSGGIYTPPSLRGTIVRPSWAGGANWGSGAVDEQRQILVANTNDLPLVVTLLPREQGRQQAASGDYKRSEFAAQHGTPYVMRREPLLSPLGIPCTAPPWGSLHAVDLAQGKLLWSVPLGTTRDVAPWPFWWIRGVPALGGPLVTGAGLVFIGAAVDNYLRAFDLASGQELWKGRLPAGGQATPMSYTHGGRQFIVIAAGGHKTAGTKLGDHLLAFALPAP
jgi:quinoprotein glucose dehydrogenase